MNWSIRESQHLPILAGICLFLFLFDLGGRDIWDIDEGMHAAIAQTMINTGDWVTPVFNGEAFFDKPPLFNWLTALSFLAFGMTEFAARLPAALAGLGCVFLAYSIGKRIYGPTTALLSGIVLATSLEIILLSRVVQYDIPFTFFTTLCLYFCVTIVLDKSNRTRNIAGFYAAGALAVLVKGPIGVLVPGAAFFVFLVWSRNFVVLRQLFMPSGLLVFAAVVTPWFVLMEQANDGYLNYFIVKQHFGNFLGGEGMLQPRHPEPFYYYLPILFAGLLPWSFLLPQSAWHAVKRERSVASGAPVFLVVWLIVIFLFFSAATSKLSTYLLPVFPAAAILVARYCDITVFQSSDIRRRSPIFVFAVISFVLLLFSIYIAVAEPWTYWKFRTGIDWWKFEVFVFVLTGISAGAFMLELSRQLRTQFGLLALLSPILVFYILWVISPGVDPYKGAKDIGAELDKRIPRGEKIHFHGQMLDSAMFYTDREAVMLRSAEDLGRYLDSDSRVYALLRTRVRQKEDAFQGDYEIIKIIGNKAIVSNQPDPAE